MLVLSPSARQLAIPDGLSEQLKVTVGAVMYQPCAPSGDVAATVCVIVGSVRSILYPSLSVPLFVLPATSEHGPELIVTFSPSSVPLDLLKVAEQLVSPDVASSAEKPFVTAETYQPWSPAVPDTNPSSLIVGAVASSFTVTGAASVVNLASLVHDPLNVVPVVSLVCCWSAVHTTGVLIVSEPDVEIVTSPVNQPALPTVPVAASVAEG